MNKEEEFALLDDIYQYTEPYEHGTEFERVWIRDIWEYLDIDQMERLYSEAKQHKNIRIGINLKHVYDMEKRITKLEERMASYDYKLEQILKRGISLD